MRPIIVLFAFFLLMLPATSGFAQECYNPTLKRAKELFDQKKYAEARRAFMATKSCPERPANDDVDNWISRCDREMNRFEVTPTSVSFNHQGGTSRLIVTASGAWNVTGVPAWCSVERGDNFISLRCEPNSGNAARSGSITVISGGQNVKVNIQQRTQRATTTTQADDPLTWLLNGDRYYNGDGVPQDYVEALKWYRRAADKDIAIAQRTVGLMYYSGLGVEQNIAEALMWFVKAGEGGDVYAQWFMGAANELAENWSEAFKWYRMAAELGEVTSQRLLGNLYFNGNGTAKNDNEALRWFRKAADGGEAVAQRVLGQLYLGGIIVQKNEAEAAKWYRLAAEQDDATAQYWWGGFLQYGMGGVSQNDSEAVKWYRKAAENGIVDAQIQMGFMYINGYGVPKDYRESAKWYGMAAEQESAAAEYSLGVLYLSGGPNLAKDVNEAEKWIRKAAERGQEDAIKALEEAGLEFKTTQTYENDAYTGYILNGVRTKSGIYKWENGSYYAGEWKDGKPNGYGFYSYASGDYYFGQWKNNTFEGQGLYIASTGEVNNCPNCSMYVGSWVNGQKQGTGSCYDVNGTLLYRGKFNKDKPSEKYVVKKEHAGYTYNHMNLDGGDQYWGEAKNGGAEGFGVYIWNDGGIWMGTWKGSKRNGYGAHYNNGEVTTGNWSGDTYR